jgi:hypothetical protein
MHFKITIKVLRIYVLETFESRHNSTTSNDHLVMRVTNKEPTNIFKAKAQARWRNAMEIKMHSSS